MPERWDPGNVFPESLVDFLACGCVAVGRAGEIWGVVIGWASGAAPTFTFGSSRGACRSVDQLDPRSKWLVVSSSCGCLT